MATFSKLRLYLFATGLNARYTKVIPDFGVALLLKLPKDTRFSILEIQLIVKYLKK